MCHQFLPSHRLPIGSDKVSGVALYPMGNKSAIGAIAHSCDATTIQTRKKGERMGKTKGDVFYGLITPIKTE